MNHLKHQDLGQLGNLCALKRRQLGYDQATVSLYAGVSVKFISQFERGKITVQLDKVLALTSILGIDASPLNKGVDIGKIIKKTRKDLGITQASLAGFSGYSTKFIFSLEDNKKTVRFDQLLNTLHVLGIQLEFEK